MRNRPLFCGCLIAFLLLSIGIMTCGAKFVKELRTSILEEKVPDGERIRITGQVYDKEIKEDYQLLYLKNNSILYQNESLKESKIILYDKEKLNIEIGNRVEAIGEISFYEEERNPGNFNQKLYYQKENIHGAIWATELFVVDFSDEKLKNMLFEFRARWKVRLFDVMGEEDGGILAAMLLGEKEGMTEETKELYQVNGIGHIRAFKSSKNSKIVENKGFFTC